MADSTLELILRDFETFFKCPLKPDDNYSCLIKMGIGIEVQIELNASGQILMGSRVASLVSGKFRENVIRAALKSNEETRPSTGSFGFSLKTNHLILFMTLNPELINPNYLLSILPPFLTKAKTWKESLSKGEIPTISEGKQSAKQPSGLFGLL